MDTDETGFRGANHNHGHLRPVRRAGLGAPGRHCNPTCRDDEDRACCGDHHRNESLHDRHPRFIFTPLHRGQYDGRQRHCRPSYGNSRTTRNPLAPYRTSRSYLKRAIERRYFDLTVECAAAQYPEPTLPHRPWRAVVRRRRDNCRSSNLQPTRLRSQPCRKDRTGSAYRSRPGRSFVPHRSCTPGNWLGRTQHRDPTSTGCSFRPGPRIPIRPRTEADRSAPSSEIAKSMNSLASSQLTLMTGRLPRPQLAIIRAIFAPSFVHAFVPLVESHFVTPDCEGLGDGHATHRILVFGRRAHVE